MLNNQSLQSIINPYFDQINQLNFNSPPQDLIDAVNSAINQLQNGQLRVAEKVNGDWLVHQYLKKAVLLFFRLQENQLINHGYTNYFDKITSRFANYSADQFKQELLRVVPPAVARVGSFIGKNTVLMPSYINIGAYVGENTMIDTWATIGSCAQIGNNVHISGGAGIGGVLEPLQANPTIIEDNCFIGARSEIVEGVIVEEDSVISMGVYIGQSTKIYNRQTGEITYGKIPKGSVVVSGSLPAKDNTHNLSAAIIIKQIDKQTRAKTSINQLLRA